MTSIVVIVLILIVFDIDTVILIVPVVQEY